MKDFLVASQLPNVISVNDASYNHREIDTSRAIFHNHRRLGAKDKAFNWTTKMSCDDDIEFRLPNNKNNSQVNPNCSWKLHKSGNCDLFVTIEKLDSEDSVTLEIGSSNQPIIYQLSGQFNFTTSEKDLVFHYLSAPDPSKSTTIIRLTALDSKDKTTYYIIIFVCCSIGLFILVVIVYVIRCYIMGTTQETTGYVQTDLELKNKIEKIINKSPKIKFCEVKSKYNQTGCSVCLLPFERESIVRLLLCAHIFHEVCIMSWLSSKTENFTCPICNTELKYEETIRNPEEHMIFHNDFI